MSDALSFVEIEIGDFALIWPVLEPMIREGETYPLPRDLDQAGARAVWAEPGRRIFAAMEDGACVGTYYIRPNQGAAGAHVANAGYVVAPAARGRGLAKRLCLHSFETARAQGYRAMQFNLVISTNAAAVRAWTGCGMNILATLPGAFNHPRFGYVDAYLMHRML